MTERSAFMVTVQVLPLIRQDHLIVPKRYGGSAVGRGRRRPSPAVGAVPDQPGHSQEHVHDGREGAGDDQEQAQKAGWMGAVHNYFMPGGRPPRAPCPGRSR